MKKKEIDPDFELNIASIIDCFTVLITYLLVASSFITLGMLDVTVAAHSSKSEPEEKPPELTVTIGVMRNNDIKISTEGLEHNSFKINHLASGKDFDTLTNTLQKLKGKYPNLDSAMVTAEDTIEYKDLVKTVEVTRNTLPKVALSADADIPGAD